MPVIAILTVSVQLPWTFLVNLTPVNYPKHQIKQQEWVN